MKNTANHLPNSAANPLKCLSVTPLNPCSHGVTVTVNKRPDGWYRVVAYVKGKFYAASSGKGKADNINYIKEALAEGGYAMPETPKKLAPVMSAKLPKKPRKAA